MNTTPALAGPERVISADGTPIAYWRGGMGPALLLIHGAMSDHRRWRIAPLLHPHRTVYAMDRRGRGASGDAPTGHWSARSKTSCPSWPPWHNAQAARSTSSATRSADWSHCAPPRSAPTCDVWCSYEPESLPSWPTRVAAAHTVPRELSVALTWDPAQGHQITVPTLLILGADSRDFAKRGIRLVEGVLADSTGGRSRTASSTSPTGSSRRRSPGSSWTSSTTHEIHDPTTTPSPAADAGFDTRERHVMTRGSKRWAYPRGADSKAMQGHRPRTGLRS